VRGMIKIMEKNYFAITGFRLWLVLVGSAITLLVLGVLAAGLISGTAVGVAAGLSPLLLILPGAILARRLGWGWSCALAMPFMIPVVLYGLLNSTFVTVRNGGIRWRETFYPLETLRAGDVR